MELQPFDVEPLSHALAHMQDALKLLDEAKAPEDIGAYLDLAIARLTEVINNADPTGRAV